MEETAPKSLGQSPNPLKNKNFFIRVILYIVIAASIYAILTYSFKYLLSSSQNPNIISQQINLKKPLIDKTNWETYGNTNYQYSLKYPSNWTVSLSKEGFSGSEANVGTSSEVVVSGLVSGDTLKINILVSSTNLDSLETDFNSATGGKGIGGQIIVTSKENTKVDQVEAIRYTADFPNENVNLHFIRNKKRFVISSFYDKNFPENLIFFNEIVSTFKFLE